MGTAVTVQAMVLGNLGMDSGTGVGFTRNPSNGDRQVFGEYLPNAQGEDIVAGIRTPLSISTLADGLPSVYYELLELAEQLERHYKDVQDFEFTVEQGKLFLLQTRAAKRAGLAAVKSAVDMANEGLIPRREAMRWVKPEDLVEMLSPRLDLSESSGCAIVTSLPASPGAAVGLLAFSAKAAVAMHAEGGAVILLTESEGVGELIRMAIASVRRVNPAIKIGVCGEHGGDPASIAFFPSLGVDYVSCSPARLLVARFAVAKAGLASAAEEDGAALALAS